MPNRNEQTDNAGRKSPEKPRADNDAAKKSLKSEDKAEAKKWDIIDESAWESFPASDSPASWAGRDISPEERDELRKKQPKD